MRKHRQATKVSRKRWTQYALASVVTSLGLNPAANADVTYIEVSRLLEDRRPGNGAFDDFDPYPLGASGASFVFRQALSDSGPNVGSLTIRGYGNISFVGASYQGAFYPNNLSRCALVSSNLNFGVGPGETGNLALGTGNSHSQFLEAGPSNIGFRFDVGRGTQYGWIEVFMFGAPNNRAIFFAYGYASPNEPVRAGFPADCIVPEPGALGLLALGSVALLAWRKQRAQNSE